MSRWIGWAGAALAALAATTAAEGWAAAPVSSATEACLGCHAEVTPGIVADWRASRHSRVSPGEALRRAPRERRVSASSAPEGLADTAVGCAECHTRDPDRHADTFEHNGFRVHVVVTPDDCAACHPEERAQYAENLMANAHGNLQDNPLYRQLAEAVNGLQTFDRGALTPHGSDPQTDADSCLACHGTRVEVTALAPRDTAFGEMTFPVLSGWPNQGVGRINPDGSKGACTSCHPRHQFSIEVARKPYTCSQCHKGPDVPAYPVYMVSKHGNIYDALEAKWDFDAVPWVPGKHFTAPTCAACHVSLLTTEGGEVVAERTHRMNDRSEYRLFGLVYAHPHPVSADTTVIKNRAGLPLPTELTGELAEGFLIGPEEQRARRERMQKICHQCHSRQWTDGHFARLDRTVETTNAMTLAATRIVLDAWGQGLARGPAQGDSPFNEALERKWVSQWLFYANSTRFASAMGGADYGVFANGRFQLCSNLQEMLDWVGFLRGAKPAP
ncbi:MAG: multiheme c-type cytochrome [Deferrisomatales bacterium]